MKTVIDAVNYIKANVLNIQNYNNALRNIRFNEGNEDEYLGFFMSNFDKRHYSSFVCTVDEFNACVDELSAATWIDGMSIEEWKAGMKNTVIDSHGNELELNKIYEFSDNHKSWNLYVLKGCNNVTDDNDYEYEANNCSWKFIRECQSPRGTIKKAPAKLVDGKAYQFKHNGDIFIGIYSWESKVMQDNHAAYKIADCKNIVLLVPEVK